MPPVTDGVTPLDTLLGRTGNNRGLVVELIDIFESECSDMVAELRRSLAANDAKGIQGAAHRLRGSLRLFGAGRAVGAAEELEAIGRAGALDHAGAPMQALEREARGALAVLQSYRETLTAGA